MSGLKTLKDLKWAREHSKAYEEYDLKQEAIKFLDENRDVGKFWDWCRLTKGKDYLDNVSPLEYIHWYVEWFFNITEEDRI